MGSVFNGTRSEVVHCRMVCRRLAGTHALQGSRFGSHEPLGFYSEQASISHERCTTVEIEATPQLQKRPPYWFVAHVKPSYERIAADLLTEKGYTTFVPLYRRKYYLG